MRTWFLWTDRYRSGHDVWMQRDRRLTDLEKRIASRSFEYTDSASALEARGEDHELNRCDQGRLLCTYCRGPIPPSRICWCSNACLDKARLSLDWKVSRKSVQARDCGICVMCGVDTVFARQWWARIHRRARQEDRKVIEATMKQIGWPGTVARDFWDADHVTARADGGDDHPDNLRTLCTCCHRGRTREQEVARRKKKAGD